MKDIREWLDGLGLGKYASVFAENEVNLEILARLTEDDLRELGLPLGARKQILRALVETRERDSSTARAPAASRAPPWPGDQNGDRSR